MSVINNYTGVLHKIRAKLYHNFLPKVKGVYIARADDEASLSIEKICETMKDRGGFTGRYGELVEYVRQFLDECAYQLCDGYSVNLKYYSIHPNIGGSFASAKEPYDPEKHPVGFKFRIRGPLRDLTKNILVDLLGVAESNAFIDEYTDTDELIVNSQFTPGNIFSLTGSKIKIAGEDPGCGVFFVPVDDPSRAVKVSRIPENTTSKIIGVTPNTCYSKNRIEVRTQFNGSSTVFLKTPRIISSSFVLETA